MKTYSTKASDIKRQWHVIDASGKVLGASLILFPASHIILADLAWLGIPDKRRGCGY